MRTEFTLDARRPNCDEIRHDATSLHSCDLGVRRGTIELGS